jgi:hypothetical protein
VHRLWQGAGAVRIGLQGLDCHAGHRAIEVLSSALSRNASAALLSPRLWWSPPLMTLARRFKVHARSVAVCELYSGGL